MLFLRYENKKYQLSGSVSVSLSGTEPDTWVFSGINVFTATEFIIHHYSFLAINYGRTIWVYAVLIWKISVLVTLNLKKLMIFMSVVWSLWIKWLCLFHSKKCDSLVFKIDSFIYFRCQGYGPTTVSFFWTSVLLHEREKRVTEHSGHYQ